MAVGRSSLLFVSALSLAASAASAAPKGMTLDRYLERQTGRIMAADTDGDGRIGRAEMEATQTKGGRDLSRRFDAMDTNHDGYVDKAEIATALTRRFRRMDRNGDGIVSPDERMADRTQRGVDQPATMAASPKP